MELDELRAAWVKQGVLLERAVAVDERILKELVMSRVRRSLRPFALGRLVQALLALVLALASAMVLTAHAEDARYWVGAGLVLGFAVPMSAFSLVLCVRGTRLDPASTVLHLQAEVAHLRHLEYRCEKLAILGGTVVWLPLPLVLVEAFTGAAVLARIELPWLLANVVFGLALFVAGTWLSRRWVEREPDSALARRIVDALSGRALQRAAAHVDELGRYVREEG